ncbi:MAG: hypothetical protein M1822_000576 [Bathelium mastoideum]|nr:MAG: hypothetical protein M1822_000576 [Bathelium mastoideum]
MPRTKSLANEESASVVSLGLECSNLPLQKNQDEQTSSPTTLPSFNGSLTRFMYSTGEVASSQDRERRIAQSPFIANDNRTPRNTPLKRNGDEKTLASTMSPSKKRRKSSKYAPPSTYAHLPKLKDIFAPNLICIFIGTNPGIRTATAGHAYAHPSNRFWKLLHASGLTDRRCDPAEDVDMPRLYAMGNTNIVERPSKDAAELSKGEMEAGARVLESKMRLWKPEAVCVVGKGIWEAIVRERYGKGLGKDFEYGWQDEQENMGKGEEEEWKGARVFVATSTSGLSVSTSRAEKEAIWRPFGEWVRQRRMEKFGHEGEWDYLEKLWEGNDDIKARDGA